MNKKIIPFIILGIALVNLGFYLNNKNSKEIDLVEGYKQAKWSSNTNVSFNNGKIIYKSDGIPNHKRNAMYALPNNGVMMPTALTAYAGNDPTVAQNYDYPITTKPQKAKATTPTSLGVIGVMISGAALFNPFEVDNNTVAKKSNFAIKDSNGNDVFFLDDCNGHPTPMGQYHYHALPKCVTQTVDIVNGPSHIIGIAFDGYPIYGNMDIDGKQIIASQLDSCNGITSKTPEFPNGIYHYVLLDTNDASSSIQCFTGEVDSQLLQKMKMPNM